MDTKKVGTHDGWTQKKTWVKPTIYAEWNIKDAGLTTKGRGLTTQKIVIVCDSDDVADIVYEPTGWIRYTYMNSTR